MSTLFTARALERLRDQLLPFGEHWHACTGRELLTVRDGLDFLVMMKNRDELWTTLASASDELSYRGELQALRDALPQAPIGEQESAAGRLASLGLSNDEVATLLAALAKPEGVGDAIRDAFAAERPPEIAQALEQVLDTSPEVIVTDRHIRRFARRRGLGRVLGVLTGIALFLMGASLAAAGDKPPPSPERGDSATASKADSRVKRAKPAPKPGPRPRYKGISPRPRRSEALASGRTAGT